jgi:hypothetical protein
VVTSFKLSINSVMNPEPVHSDEYVTIFYTVVMLSRGPACVGHAAAKSHVPQIINTTLLLPLFYKRVNVQDLL